MALRKAVACVRRCPVRARVGAALCVDVCSGAASAAGAWSDPGVSGGPPSVLAAGELHPKPKPAASATSTNIKPEVLE